MRRVLLLFLAGTLLVGAIGGALALWLRPLTLLEIAGRAALRGAGFRKAVLDTPQGPLTVFRRGEGRTVVLLHGVNDQAGGWARVAGPLARTHHVIVVDLPGHGESAPLQGPLTVEALLAGVDAVLAAEPRPAVLVGNSMGGWLALLHARAHPEQVTQVVLVNGAALTAPRTVSLLPRDRDEARRTMQALLAAGAPTPPGYVLDDLVRRAPKSPLARMLGTPFQAHVLDRRLQEIQTPVTLLWGADDRLLPREYAQAIAGELPHAHLELIPGCGHMPQRECVDRLLPLLQAALAAPPPPKS